MIATFAKEWIDTKRFKIFHFHHVSESVLCFVLPIILIVLKRAELAEIFEYEVNNDVEIEKCIIDDTKRVFHAHIVHSAPH